MATPRPKGPYLRCQFLPGRPGVEKPHPRAHREQPGGPIRQAKLVIKLIGEVAAVINDDPRAAGRLRMVSYYGGEIRWGEADKD